RPAGSGISGWRGHGWEQRAAAARARPAAGIRAWACSLPCDPPDPGCVHCVHRLRTLLMYVPQVQFAMVVDQDQAVRQVALCMEVREQRARLLRLPGCPDMPGGEGEVECRRDKEGVDAQ